MEKDTRAQGRDYADRNLAYINISREEIDSLIFADRDPMTDAEWNRVRDAIEWEVDVTPIIFRLEKKLTKAKNKVLKPGQ